MAGGSSSGSLGRGPEDVTAGPEAASGPAVGVPGARASLPTRIDRAARSASADHRVSFARRFAVKVNADGVTGLSAMVAYNLLLSVFPVGLLALFIAGRVLESGELEGRVLQDLQDIFPGAAESTLAGALAGLRSSSTSFGIVALVASVWIGSSFWGALDTAFCRIYHGRCRTWLQQKAFAVAMLVFILLFMAATVAVPTVQSILVAGADDLPLGLSELPGLVYAVTLAIGLVLLFALLCVIYWSVPSPRVPWRAVWPGALIATVAIGLVDYAFPFYLSNISTIARFGTTLGFVLIVLLWFYVLAIVILGGATVNALRFERPEDHEAAR